MHDNLERAFDGCRADRARLVGYVRSFCTLAPKNWGSSENPGPTLGLVQEGSAESTGVAFEISDAHRQQVTSYLLARDGKSFFFPKGSRVLTGRPRGRGHHVGERDQRQDLYWRVPPRKESGNGVPGTR